MEPRVRRADGLLHLRYALPSQIHCSGVYPRSAPNGSELIVCGHEHGLSIVWRGGRPLRGAAKRAGEDVEMAEDSDASDEADYESEEDEIDAAHPYRPIIQHIELPLGSAVLHMAFPYLRQSHYEDVVVQPPLLQQNLVVGLACADKTIRVLTLPLAPPSSADKEAQQQQLLKTGRNRWLEGLITVSKDDHRTVPRGVSIAFAMHKDTTPDHEDEDEDLGQNLDDLWDLVVVSHSAHVTGQLHIHRVPVSEDGTFLDTSASDSLYWQSERLSAPADAVRLTVPLSPGGVTWPRVLVIAGGYPVRVFDCCADVDPDHGQWTATIYTGFESTDGRVSRQKTVVDAQWAMAGTAIIALLASGEWRMYDVAFRKGQKTLSASIPTKCALSGWVEKTASVPSSTAETTGDSRQKLTPMTPSTRKARAEALFSGRPDHSQYGSGGIAVIPTTKATSNGFVDETIIMWSGPSGLVIPSFAGYYRSRKDSADPFSGGVAGQARELPHVELDAEIQTGVSAFAAEGKSSRLQTKHSDFLVSGQRSFVIVAAPLQQSTRLSKAPRRAVPAATDETLLAAGDLDVGGLDRMLDSMADGSTSPSAQAKQRRVNSRR